jgi:V/A-type H+-transporting ATPase subunit I
MQNNWNFQYAMHPIGTIFLTIAATIAVTKVNFLDMGSLFEVLFGITAMQLSASITSEMILIPLVIGAVLLFLFNNPSKPVFVRVPLGLWEFYQFTTGLMGDGLSYIRLFALGLAGGLLGASFNKIAIMVCGGEFSFNTPLVIAAILVLVFGHGINFLLACLSSFVHPLRLTFVEFYKHIEFQGGAREYKPFSKVEA